MKDKQAIAKLIVNTDKCIFDIAKLFDLHFQEDEIKKAINECGVWQCVRCGFWVPESEIFGKVCHICREYMH